MIRSLGHKLKKKRKEEHIDFLFTPVAQWVGHDHSPGLCSVQQQQWRHAAMGQGVPVDAVTGAVLQSVPEMEVQVQNIHLEGVGDSAWEEVCIDDIVSKPRSFMCHLGSVEKKKRRAVAAERAGVLDDTWHWIKTGTGCFLWLKLMAKEKVTCTCF